MGEPEPLSVVSSDQLRKPAKLGGYLNYSLSSSFLMSPEPEVVEEDMDSVDDDLELEAVESDESDSNSSLPVGSFYGITKTGQYSLHYSGGFDFSVDQSVNLSNLNLQKI